MTLQFKDSMNRFITSGLFKETAQLPDYILMTLDEGRQRYIECNDPTGYLFATTYMGGWKHWLAVKASSALSNHIILWEEELEIKLRSEALISIYNESKKAKGYQAAKYIVEGGWKDKTVGRPTNKKIRREARIHSKMYSEFNNVSTKLDS